MVSAKFLRNLTKYYRMKIQTPENYDSLWVMRGRPYDFNTKTFWSERGRLFIPGSWFSYRTKYFYEIEPISAFWKDGRSQRNKCAIIWRRSKIWSTTICSLTLTTIIMTPPQSFSPGLTYTNTYFLKVRLYDFPRVTFLIGSLVYKIWKSPGQP